MRSSDSQIPRMRGGRSTHSVTPIVYCSLYIQRALATSRSGVAEWAQTTRQTGCTHSGAHWALPTVNIEGTDNQSDRGHTVRFRGHGQPISQEHRVGHTGAVNCTYRGHIQPYRQGHTKALPTVHTEGTDNQSTGDHWATVYCTYKWH